MKIGNIVYVPCRIMSMSEMAYTKDPIIDLRVIESTSGEVYALTVVKQFSVFGRDVKVSIGETK